MLKGVKQCYKFLVIHVLLYKIKKLKCFYVYIFKSL